MVDSKSRDLPADRVQDTEWQRPYQDSPGPDTLAQTPEPFSPERKHDSPGKVPVQPPAEPPNPNPVHIPPATPQPGDLPASNPDVVGSGAVGEEALNRARPTERA
ncbi:MAG TPA: hypothetical protein VJM53_01310 [Burkholderiales bacterium]|nr:hypothetical protein [Burkholderiales bacterium]